MQDDPAFGILRRLGRGPLIWLGTRRDMAKVLFYDGTWLRRINITDHGNDHIGRNVVRVEKVLRVSGGKAVQIRVVPDPWTMVRVRHISLGDELFDETADGVAIGAHAPLFGDHISLF